MANGRIFNLEQRELANLLGEKITKGGVTYQVMKNGSAGTLAARDVVIVDAAGADYEATTTTSSADPLVAGVVHEDSGTIAVGEYMLVVIDGVTSAKVTGKSGGSAVGDRLLTHTVAKQSTSTASTQTAGTSLGVLLEEVTSGTAGTPDVLVRLR